MGITWYEAVAFCNWLNAAFRPEELKLPNKSWKVRLPSEAEWERAARHTDARDFPWDPTDKVEMGSRCNCRETQLGHTSAVGLFPSGNAVCGAADMAGNVLEWTRSGYRNYPDDPMDAPEKLESNLARVLRGGSWFNGADRARCGFRDGEELYYRISRVGFRLAASPFSKDERSS